jgi:type IV secretion system protein VirB9
MGALCGSAGQAESVPVKGVIDPRIRTAVYSADEIFRLYGFVGYHIDLEFEPDETFTSLSGGDLEALTYSAHDNVLTLKPKVASTEMNLAVTTSKRRYYFQYTAVAHRPNPFADQVMYAVRFLYPGTGRPGAQVEPEVIDRHLAQAAAAAPRNTNYWFCGHRSLRPVAAADDGAQTRLTFHSKAEIPAIFVRNDDGSESLLNFNVENGAVVIQRLAPKLVLRRGKLTGCIVNRGYTGSGGRLATGTISPEVERDVRAQLP